MHRWWERLRSARGAASVEYAIMLAAIAAAVILAAYFMGGETADGFDCVARKFQLRADVC